VETFSIIIELDSRLGTPLRGDTLFGHICWVVRDAFGEVRLKELLDGYTQGKPFLIMSDACPEGYWPKPCLPLSLWFTKAGNRVLSYRKALEKAKWLKTSVAARIGDMESVIAAIKNDDFFTDVRQHNSINRATNTTKGEEFAPYTTENLYPTKPHLPLEITVLIDTQRLSWAEAEALFAVVGAMGYGRDRTIGAGAYRLIRVTSQPAASLPSGATCLALAPCLPTASSIDARYSFYRPLTHFGRHGQSAAHEQVFKTPIIMAQTGAVFTINNPLPYPFLGRGLGGEAQPISCSIPSTVQQAYAPVVPLPIAREAWHEVA
jgi:CRISPR-associated protein Csm4